MKKIYALTGVLLLRGMAMTGCKDDTEPRAQIPTEFILNTPPMVNYTYDLAGDRSSTVDISVSQANYGMALTPVYTVQLSLSGEFNAPFVIDEETGVASGDYYTLYGAFTNVHIQIPAEMFSIGTTALQGYTDKEEEASYVEKDMPVYVRVISTVGSWANGTIASNPILLPSVRPFFALRQPGQIYLIGEPQGWDISNPSWALSEADNGIGSNIYYGRFNADAGTFGPFRFYTELGDWEANSVGSQADDNPIQYDFDTDFENGVFEGKAVNGKGSWTINNWPGGDIRMTVNLKTMEVVFELAK